jgi:hypothetical protein
MNWIAHPKSGVSRVANKNGEDVLVPCNQYMLSGGAAWDNGMDGIYSIQRPNSLIDITDPSVRFHNLKQRMQDLVAERGMIDDIIFDIKNRRYIFSDYSPLDSNKPLKKVERFPQAENNFDEQTGEILNTPF